MLAEIRVAHTLAEPGRDQAAVRRVIAGWHWLYLALPERHPSGKSPRLLKPTAEKSTAGSALVPGATNAQPALTLPPRA